MSKAKRTSRTAKGEDITSNITSNTLFASKIKNDDLVSRLMRERENIREENSSDDPGSSNGSNNGSNNGSGDIQYGGSRNDRGAGEFFTEYANEDLIGGAKARSATESKIKTQSFKSAVKNKLDIRDISKLRRTTYEVREDEDNTADLENRAHPIAMKLDFEVPDLSQVDPDPRVHRGIPYPRFNSGFFHWAHSAKNKTEEFSKFEGKKKVYLVVHEYESTIDDYDQSIGDVSATYFGEPVTSRSFYKMWEIIHYYDLIGTEAGFSSVHLADTGFAQATMQYRDRYAKNSKNDSYYSISAHTEKVDALSDDNEDATVSKDKRLKIHKTKNNGDLTSTKTIEQLKKDIGSQVELVTGDGGFDWTNENIQEQEASVLIFAQIVTALSIQKKGGSFVLKMYEMFTNLSLKFMMILQYCYEDVRIIKPLTSRESNSERYIVCKGAKFDQKSISPFVAKLMSALESVAYTSESRTSDSDFFVDIFPSTQIPSSLFTQILSVNTSLVVDQYKVINKMIEFIHGSNYHGDTYRKYRERQIEMNSYWIRTFFPDTDKKSDAIAESQNILAVSEQNEASQLKKLLSNYESGTEATQTVKVTKKKPVAKKISRATKTIKAVKKNKKTA